MIEAKLCDPQIKRKTCKSLVLSCELDGKIQKGAPFPHCPTLLQPYQTSSSAIRSCTPPNIFLCSFLHLGCSSSWDVPGNLQLTREDHVRIHFFLRQDTFAGLPWADFPRPLQCHPTGGCPLVFHGAGIAPVCMPTSPITLEVYSHYFHRAF